MESTNTSTKFDPDAFEALNVDDRWAALRAKVTAPGGFFPSEVIPMATRIVTHWDERTPASSENVVFRASPIFSSKSPNVFMRCVQINIKVGLVLYLPRFSTLEKLRHEHELWQAEYDEKVRQHLFDWVAKSGRFNSKAQAEYEAAVALEWNAYREKLMASGAGDYRPLESAPPDVRYVNPMWWCPRCNEGRHVPVQADHCVLDVLDDQGVDITNYTSTGEWRVCSFDPDNVPVPISNILNEECFKLPVVRGHRSEAPCPVTPLRLSRAARRKPSQHFTTFAKMTHATGKILEYGKH